MSRLTRQEENKHIIDAALIVSCENGCSGPAVEKLAAFESLAEAVQNEQGQISATLEQLRNQGKKNSAQFRELMGKKLMNSALLARLSAHGLL